MQSARAGRRVEQAEIVQRVPQGQAQERQRQDARGLDDALRLRLAYGQRQIPQSLDQAGERRADVLVPGLLEVLGEAVRGGGLAGDERRLLAAGRAAAGACAGEKVHLEIKQAAIQLAPDELMGGGALRREIVGRSRARAQRAGKAKQRADHPSQGAARPTRSHPPGHFANPPACRARRWRRSVILAPRRRRRQAGEAAALRVSTASAQNRLSSRSM